VDKDSVINKVLRDMKQDGVVCDDGIGVARIHLTILYNAAYERGTTHYGHSNSKKIVQYDKYGDKIDEFDNQLVASKIVGYTDRAISRALKTGRPTRAGHIWKYADDEDTCRSTMGERGNGE